ncbi:hypothetical protein F2Q70_00003897 [Brassica cretica]|uniref:Aspartic peptidase DDI1-type domain-containing protein n=1 Tax=Brassica cretica TaxID=69181 RepID=A0A8S9IP16_BRACR|nr:hypothetical protein F2Q70_00003897 [Brassica cretica]
MEQATAEHIQNQNQRQPQSNRQAVPATENNQPDELKGLVTAPSEPAETPPVRVYVPKVLYPISPKHLMDPISAEQLAGFRKMVRRLPQKISFEHAWEIRPLHMFFKNCRESQEEIKALFTEALTPSLKVLPKVDDPGKFVFPCSIAGVEFKEALCDSGSSVNLVSKAIVDELGIVDVEPSQVKLATPPVRVYVPMVPYPIPPKHLMDPISAEQLAGFRKMVRRLPQKISFEHAWEIRPLHIGEQLEIVSKKELGKKGEIKEVLDGDPHIDTKKLNGNVKLDEKVQKKRVILTGCQVPSRQASSDLD